MCNKLEQRKNMKVVVGTATCIWFFIMLVMSSSATRDEGVTDQLQLGAYDIVTYNLENGIADYPTFLANLRPKFEGPLKACGLPVTRDTRLKNNEYVLANLKISDTKSVTLALNDTNLYLVAYCVYKKYDGKYRAVFFKEPDRDFAKKNLFNDKKTTQQEDLTYDSNYKSIEDAAGHVRRKKIPLGYQELRKRIELFFGQEEPITGVEEAKFLLVAIQMVSEATRYKYIENEVVKSGDHSFKPDDKMIDLETSWQKTSDAVRKAEKDMECDSTKVKNIKKDTALLKFERKTRPSINFFDGEFFARTVGDLID